MRLVKVAKALGMTGQELRHELEDVDFGIKPTDREIPDNLAQGVIRFIARKKNISVDMESLGFSFDELDQSHEVDADEGQDHEQEEEEEEKTTPEQPVAKRQASVKQESDKDSERTETLNVLRKLTLEDVSPDAIKKQRRQLANTSSPGKGGSSAASQRKGPPKKRATEGVQEQIKKKEGTVVLPEQVTVKEFAEKTGVQVPKVVAALMKNGVMATVNQTIDFDTAAIVAAEMDVHVQKEESTADVEHLFSRNLEEMLKDEPENLTDRAPVVVVMGHVDHGKTSILDVVRETDVVSGEAGGITQHIGAYQIRHKTGGDEHPITFLDTPGHEAFTAMRARGAQLTDVAIIVVAADEGIKPTTVEAINHAKEAGVPIIVAINKMDKEGADPDKVKGELAAHDLQAEDWGGNTPTVLCSALTKKGIDDLLDTVVLVSQMNEVKANPDRSAVATVIESHLDSSLGSLATVVINTGTLNVGDSFVCGNTHGKVRAMMDAHGQRMKEVPPSGAVRISGFDNVPEVGDILQVVTSEQEAREVVQKVREMKEQTKKRSFADLVSRLSEGKLNLLRIVLKADTQGSLQAIEQTLAQKTTDEVSVKVIHSAVGSVSENDVMMAAASDGMVIAFHASVPNSVKNTAEREGVQVREYDIVYELFDEVDALLSGLVEPVEEEQVIGHLEVKEIFLTKRKEQIIGGRVTDGSIKKLPFRLLRDGEPVGEGRIMSLKHVDKDIKEAKEGSDCGMRVDTSVAVEEGDVVEVYAKELKRKS